MPLLVIPKGESLLNSWNTNVIFHSFASIRRNLHQETSDEVGAKAAAALEGGALFMHKYNTFVDQWFIIFL